MAEEDVLQLRSNFASALVKLGYAFLWQESVLTDAPWVFDPEVNVIGADLLPVVNSLANGLNNFEYYEQNFQVRKSYAILT